MGNTMHTNSVYGCVRAGSSSEGDGGAMSKKSNESPSNTGGDTSILGGSSSNCSDRYLILSSGSGSSTVGAVFFSGETGISGLGENYPCI